MSDSEVPSSAGLALTGSLNCRVRLLPTIPVGAALAWPVAPDVAPVVPLAVPVAVPFGAAPPLDTPPQAARVPAASAATASSEVRLPRHLALAGKVNG